jgi:hypothetical protein
MHAAVFAPEDKSSFTRVIEFLTSFACWEQTRTQFAQPMHLSASTSAWPFIILIALAGHSRTHE